jgi:hypothetical protein
MGNYSYFLVATNGAERCVVDWDACDFPSECGKSEGYHITWLAKADEERPRTLLDMAKKLNDRKLFGYLDNGYIAAIRQVSLHAKAPEGEFLMPRIYFEEEGWLRLHYLEFHLGTDTVVWGSFSYDEKDLPPYLEEEDETHPVTVAMLDAWTEEKRKVQLAMLNKPGWRARHLVPSDPSQHNALPTLMAIFGIRPEDPDSLERAAKFIDIKKALNTPASRLLEHPTEK